MPGACNAYPLNHASVAPAIPRGKRRVIEVQPDAAGVVRVMQFVDSFIVPRVMISMPGMDRPLEVLCSKVIQHRLKDTDGDALRDAKLPDAMGNEGARWVHATDVPPRCRPEERFFFGILLVDLCGYPIEGGGELKVNPKWPISVM